MIPEAYVERLTAASITGQHYLSHRVSPSHSELTFSSLKISHYLVWRKKKGRPEIIGMSNVSETEHSGR